MLPATYVAAVGLAAVSSMLASWYAGGTTKFVPGACERAETFLSQHVVGQELAINQLVDAVCLHLNQKNPTKPLIISAHGPSGVGKTYTHVLLARALYNKDPEAAIHCPGYDCQGAKVIYGMDFIQDVRAEQLNMVRAAVLEHVKSVADPLLVIEEYDKLDCASRAMLRQLLQHPELANATFNRAIVMLESNLGFTELEQLLTSVGDRSKITAEAAERTLKNSVFELWQSEACEEYQDTLKFTSLIDFVLPYFPFQRPQIEQLMSMELATWANKLWHEKHLRLQWQDDVIQFLCDKVDFDGPYPLEGAKQVSTVTTRYLARLVRKCPEAVPAFRGTSKERAAKAPAALLRVKGQQLGLDVQHNTQ